VGWLVGPSDVVISYLFGRPILSIHELVWRRLCWKTMIGATDNGSVLAGTPLTTHFMAHRAIFPVSCTCSYNIYKRWNSIWKGTENSPSFKCQIPICLLCNDGDCTKIVVLNFHSLLSLHFTVSTIITVVYYMVWILELIYFKILN